MRSNSNPKSKNSASLARQFSKQRVFETAAQLERLLCERSLADYVRQAWPILNPGTPFISNWHIELICEYLHACNLGQIKRLIINQPPKTTKSTIISAMWPTWWWGPENHPDARWLFASYSERVSSRDSLNRRTIISSDWYRKLWGMRVRLLADQNQKNIFQNTARGQMLATTMSGQGPGLGGNYLVIDDPHDTEKVTSQKERERALRNFDHKLYTRLDDRIDGVIVIVMQRLHTKDLTGHLLAAAGGANWELLCIPMEAPDRKVYVFPLSNKEYVREAGELLNPSREGPEQLTEHKERLGTLGYAAQFQQQPVPEGGAIFKRDHFKLWPEEIDQSSDPPKFIRIIQSWDTAIKDSETNSFSVCTTWGEFEGGYFLLDVWRRHAEFTEMLDAMHELAARWNPAAILVEDKSSGQSAIQVLRHTGLPVIPISVDSDKTARAKAASPTAQAGRVWIPRNAPWAALYLDELCNYPRSEFTDQLDSTTQFINWARDNDWAVFQQMKEFQEEERQRKIREGRPVRYREDGSPVYVCAMRGCGNEFEPGSVITMSRGLPYCCQDHAGKGPF